MADFPCVNPCIECPTVPPGADGLGLSPNDPNNPFANLSSEAPDVDLFIGRRRTPPGIGGPPLGSNWFAVGCLGFAFSSVSQEDANLQAQAQSVLCVGPLWPIVVDPSPATPPNPDNPDGPATPPNIIPRSTFYNQAQSCDFTCPDGSVFTFVVPAGVFAALSQAAADAAAQSYACNQVAANAVCFGSGPTETTCLDAAYSSSVGVSSPNLPIAYTIQSGELPPGLSPSQSTTTFFLSGTPNIPGSYTFLLRATDSIGGIIEKQVTISVFGIVNTSPLPEASVGDPYSETLITAGGSGPVAFSLIGGSLPAGLTLNGSTGEISGTPTEDGGSSLIIQINDGALVCQKAFTIEVVSDSACGEIFASPAWSEDFALDNNGGTTSVIAAGPSIQMTSNAPLSTATGDGTPTLFEVNRSSDAVWDGSVMYQGPEIECCVRVTVIGTPLYSESVPPKYATSSCASDFSISCFPMFLSDSYSGDSGNGVHEYNFTIPECLVPTEIEITVSSFAGTSAGANQMTTFTGPEANMSITVELAACSP